MAFGSSGNPTLKRAFQLAREDAGSGTMTLTGAINKAGILLMILIASSAFAWNAENPSLMFIGLIGGLITALTLSFNPSWAPMAAPAYAVLEGLALGTVSKFAEMRYPGIAVNAMALTFGTMGVMLACYRTGLLRATPVFQRTIILATAGIAILYIVSLVMSLFGMSIPMLHDASPLGIGISVVITGIAAFNLILDFDLFERNSYGSPKYMEWYCGFSLLVTLVWLYIEILNLLNKLNRR